MSDTKDKIRVGITQGDINGVGMEVIVKALSSPEICELFTPVIFGSSEVAARTVTRLHASDFRFTPIDSASQAQEGRINLVEVCGENVHQTPGLPSAEGGEAALKALENAVAALKNEEIDVLVTAPIDKKTIHGENFVFPGHTEYLESNFGDGKEALMIMVADGLRVALVTTHMALKDVPAALSSEKIEKAIRNFNNVLRRDFGCERPKIAVLSLNPHCGDSGLLGTEESELIAPAIENCVKDNLVVLGPVAADGLFGSGAYLHFDGILAMYHDQGLAPFKALAREKGVNYTACLEIVRTSPAHGTAYDKAGLGTADETSMRQAIYEAIDIWRRRQTFDKVSANPLERHEVKPREQKKSKPFKPEETE